jgi:hypothetical protein
MPNDAAGQQALASVPAGYLSRRAAASDAAIRADEEIAAEVFPSERGSAFSVGGFCAQYSSVARE